MTQLNKERIRAARRLAVDAHREQRYGAHPYVYHLDAVHRVLDETMIDDEDVLVASFLHDALEDTALTKAEIEERFGARVAALVWAVTGVGATRKLRLIDACNKIRETPGAATLKLADRIANTEESKLGAPKLFEMYKGEFDLLFAMIGDRGAGPLWKRLAAATDK
jgi:(p)ppGpp synthase/HD superfamily hydrolase